MLSPTYYRKEFNAYLKKNTTVREPLNLYEPLSYMLGLGGKRIRPLLLLIATDALGGDYRRGFDAALALEVFHNFSLVHDDIMDEAPLRRGKPTVHKKWDVNRGLLSGDAMLITAYTLLESYEAPLFRDLVTLFSTTARQVCEGQQYDLDFQDGDEVRIADYLKMITFKTAVLLAAAMKMGAMIAAADSASQEDAYDFGLNLGIAFQLQDDYLDAFGDPAKFGKRLGGDIIENKKTYLFIKAMEYAGPENGDRLKKLFSERPDNHSEKIEMVKAIYLETGVDKRCRVAIGEYTEKAFAALQRLPVSAKKRSLLRDFGQRLMDRMA